MPPAGRRPQTVLHPEFCALRDAASERLDAYGLVVLYVFPDEAKRETFAVSAAGRAGLKPRRLYLRAALYLFWVWLWP